MRAAPAAGSSGIGTPFIDVGFGTLDPDGLDVALSCLEALQASGRQRRVEPLGGGRSARAAAPPVPETLTT